jgi:Carboxypeptidase regulatory-like domain
MPITRRGQRRLLPWVVACASPRGGSVRRFILLGAALLLLGGLLFAQSKGKKAEDASAPRNLTGAVFDPASHPVPNAVVYLKNMRNLTIDTYLTGDDGAYRFNRLSSDIEYQVRAESGGRKSKSKTLGAYSSRKQVRINLKLAK